MVFWQKLLEKACLSFKMSNAAMVRLVSSAVDQLL